jgi:hypothetical protein
MELQIPAAVVAVAQEVLLQTHPTQMAATAAAVS